MMKRFNQSVIIFLFTFLISIPLILPFMQKGYFPTHDGEWAVVRMGDMFRSLRDQQLPVRYSGNLNFSYGYPLFNFTYPAPYYIGTVFHFFNIGFVDSVKLLFVLSVIVSSLTMFLLATEIWKNKIAGFISAVFYLYLPYRIVDLYARGSIGESLSFALFPLVLFFVVKMFDKSSKYYLLFGAITYALLIMTHNIMAVLFTPIILIFIIMKIITANTKENRIKVVLFFLFSYALSAFFWLPALLEKSNILLSRIPIADRDIYFVTLNQLFIPKWGFGLPDHADGFSYQIGLFHFFIVISAGLSLGFLWFKQRKQYKEQITRIALALVLSVVVLISLMFSFTSFIWESLPLLKEINYPWTLLAIIGFMISLLAGFLWLQSNYLKYFVIACAIGTILLVLPHAKPEYSFDKGDMYYLTNEGTTTSSQELMPLWVKNLPVSKSAEKVEIIKGEGTVKDIVYNSKSAHFNLQLASESVIRFNVIYYPGWVVEVDGVQRDLAYNNNLGVMEFSAPAGDHQVTFKFSETPLRLLSDFISLLSLLALVVLGIIYKVKK